MPREIILFQVIVAAGERDTEGYTIVDRDEIGRLILERLDQALDSLRGQRFLNPPLHGGAITDRRSGYQVLNLRIIQQIGALRYPE
jgi:hypothetical protein